MLWALAIGPVLIFRVSLYSGWETWIIGIVGPPANLSRLSEDESPSAHFRCSPERSSVRRGWRPLPAVAGRVQRRRLRRRRLMPQHRGERSRRACRVLRARSVSSGTFPFFQDLKRIWKSKRLIVSSWSRTVLLRTVHTETASECSDEGGTCRYMSTGCPEGDFISSLCPEQYNEVMCCVPSP